MMNERINELHQQAKDFINEVSDNDGTYQGKEYPQAVREKFAELIVKDCAAYVKRQCMQPSTFTAADLLERYGIKDE